MSPGATRRGLKCEGKGQSGQVPSRESNGRSRRFIRDTPERPVVVPVVVIAVHVHVALVIPAVERGVAYVRRAFFSTTLRILPGLNRIRHLKCPSAPHEVSSFFSFANTTLRSSVNECTLGIRKLGSAAADRNLRQIRLLPLVVYQKK